MVLMGLVPSWWALLALPAAGLIGSAFAGAGLGLTTYIRSFTYFAYAGLAITPLFLFSATFFPIDRYPAAVQVLVEVSPLDQGVAIERALVLGEPTWVLLLRAAYL